MLETLNNTNGWRLALYALLSTWVIGATTSGIAQIVEAARAKPSEPKTLKA